MEVQICIPPKADMRAVEREYPDIYSDGDSRCGDLRYYVGRSSDDPLTDDDGKTIEWLTYDEAVECCGFVEGAVAGAEVTIEGNGGWAQSIIRSRDFDGLSKKEKAEYKRVSDLFYLHFERGYKTRPIKTKTNHGATVLV